MIKSISRQKNIFEPHFNFLRSSDKILIKKFRQIKERNDRPKSILISEVPATLYTILYDHYIIYLHLYKKKTDKNICQNSYSTHKSTNFFKIYFHYINGASLP